jgi:hypothetical protein
MSWLAPGYLVAALGASLVVVALHFFARRVPRPFALPTARFVPGSTVRAPSLSRRPTDLILLLLRVLALLLAGSALARPVVEPERRALARIVAIDPAGVLSAGEARDSAAALAGEGDSVVTGSAAAGLSALLVEAVRAGAVRGKHADSVELVIVSALTLGSWDEATEALRAEWPGRARLVRVAAAPPAAAGPVEVIGAPDDPLRAAIALLGARRGGAPVRVIRGAPGAADTSLAEGGAVVVFWPARPEEAWSARRAPDTIGAVVTDAAGRWPAVAAAPFARLVRLPPADSAVAIAHWADGEVAAREVAVGDGCIREVTIPVIAEGDFALRTGFRRVVERLVAPCGPRRDTAPLDETHLAVLEGGPGLAAGAVLAAELPAISSLAPWLLGAALLLLMVEQVLRRGWLRGGVESGVAAGAMRGSAA